MRLEKYFDSVLFLTWSDWAKEPRSNRYHFATRFAKELPVLFFQHKYEKRDKVEFEESGFENIDIINVNHGVTNEDVKCIKKLLSARGIRKPLIWIYDSINYNRLIEAIPQGFRVYHATEDYIIETSGWESHSNEIRDSVVKILKTIDFVVFCSANLVNSYVTNGRYKGKYCIAENGCDAEYFLSYIQKNDLKLVKSKTAVFQGGINSRLDYDLLYKVVTCLPEWTFEFYGISTDCKGWKQISDLSNVHVYGKVDVDALTEAMVNANIGIIPYIQDEWIYNSFPLKAYEYVACGLPVVTTPIKSLEEKESLFYIAKTAEEFIKAIHIASETREEKELTKIRKAEALSKSYNKSFSSMKNELLKARELVAIAGNRFNVAVLYDSSNSLHVSTIMEHLGSFKKYSHNDITYIPADHSYWRKTIQYNKNCNVSFDFKPFDAVVIHYSIRLSVNTHISEHIANAIADYQGCKILFIQDEYEGIETAAKWIEKLKLDVIFTCVPKKYQRDIYPEYRFPALSFVETLTGYVPENISESSWAKPLQERNIDIFYRGRKLPYIYGSLGYEKYKIGYEFQKIAKAHDLACDIEVDDSKRIYGEEWYKNLGSARATLGTESGSNIFDFNGKIEKEIKDYVNSKDNISYEEIINVFIEPNEKVIMNQVSPKIFESIILRTALILFEGSYSNVLMPNTHYIPLKKDFSNIDDVLAKLKDDEYIYDLTERAYKDIIISKKYSYQSFIKQFDDALNDLILHAKYNQLHSRELLFDDGDGGLKPCIPYVPLGIYINDPDYVDDEVSKSKKIIGDVQYFLSNLMQGNYQILFVSFKNNKKLEFMFSLARKCWHILPYNQRISLAKLFRLAK
ncbi:MAG: glycosyltransferase [Gammaproteobacteria bacterium]|uniref:glycosyltransferase n=1 Tax=Fulvivirga sp. TaxID=1931237 RepID=UPI0032EEBA79